MREFLVYYKGQNDAGPLDGRINLGIDGKLNADAVREMEKLIVEKSEEEYGRMSKCMILNLIEMEQ